MYLLYLHMGEVTKGNHSDATSTKGSHSNATSSTGATSSLNNGQASADSLGCKFIDYGIDYATGTVLGSHVIVQVRMVPEPIFPKVDMFYCCARCGKVFWEGSHFERVCEQYHHVLSLNDSGASVYEKLNSGS